jgi:hypothetical protein
METNPITTADDKANKRRQAAEEIHVDRRINPLP